MAKYIDLLITNRDFTLNAGNEPVTCCDRQSIGQDIIHSIIESEIAKDLIAERSPTLRGDIITRLILLVETDTRIVPGTVTISDESNARLVVNADTYDFGPLSKIEVAV